MAYVDCLHRPSPIPVELTIEDKGVGVLYYTGVLHNVSVYDHEVGVQVPGTVFTWTLKGLKGPVKDGFPLEVGLDESSICLTPNNDTDRKSVV